MPLLILLLLTTLVHAQVQTGRITGTIYDPNKAVVPNATVLITEQATNIARQATTNEVGSYVLPSLLPGLSIRCLRVRPAFALRYDPPWKCKLGKTCSWTSNCRLAK